MVWFKVDDGLHKHRKVRKALAEDPASMSLWVVAGSWSSDEGTDGFISDDQLPWLLPAGAEALARTLVAARLWSRVRGGYQFHEWTEDGDGTRRNPTREEVQIERRKKAEAGRQGGLVSAKTRSKRQAGAQASAEAGASRLLEPPTRPPPSKGRGKGSAPASLGGARPPNPPPDPAPNGSIPDPERVKALAAQAKAAIRRPKTMPARDPLKPPPDKAQAALAALDAAIAAQAQPLEDNDAAHG